jgi:hypothetical protein
MPVQVLPGARALAVLLLLTAAGILAFWVNWFVSGNFLLAEDECFRIFENTFPLPDTVMAVLMFFAATALWRGAPLGLFFGLFTAGMSLQLASLDLLYHWKNDGFADWSDPETWSRAFIVVHCYALAAGASAYLWLRRRELLHTSTGILNPRLRYPVGMITLALVNGCYAAVIAIYWAVHLLDDAPRTACAERYHDAFLIADCVTFTTMGGTALGIALRRSWAMLWGLLTTGGVSFGALIWAAYAAINPDLIEGRMISYAIFVAFLLSGAATACTFLWNRKAWFLGLDGDLIGGTSAGSPERRPTGRAESRLGAARPAEARGTPENSPRAGAPPATPRPREPQ